MSIVFCFFATLTFSILFNTPKNQLLLCGVAGVISWAVYLLINFYHGDPVLGTFLGTVATTAFCRLLAVKRKMPITVFLCGGIIPLVPGAGIYSTMYNIITNDTAAAVAAGTQTMKLAGVIAIGIGLVLFMDVK